MERALLLVDDEEGILSSLTRLFRRDGYRIFRANSGKAALEVLAQNSVNVVISDQRMPEMTGTELLSRVKELYPDTIRIVLSGYTELNSITEAINRGAIYKFLTKPWDDESLRTTVQEAFRCLESKEGQNHASHDQQENREELACLEQHVKAQDQEILLREGALQVAQEILENLPVGVLGVDENGIISMANHFTYELFGDAGGMVGKRADEVLPGNIYELCRQPEQGSLLKNFYVTLGDGRRLEVYCRRMSNNPRLRGVILALQISKV
ncbi:MAG: response regulator [Gammaproteobacteria bacterium]|nr:response regulator [Gammaproteobacteria bacterium]